MRTSIKNAESLRKKQLESGVANENSLLPDFADNPEKYEGKTLVFKLSYHQSAREGLREYTDWEFAMGRKIAFVKFHGYGPSTTGLELFLGIEKGTDLPAAQYNNELIVTVLCSVIERDGKSLATGICKKIIRAKK